MKNFKNLFYKIFVFTFIFVFAFGFRISKNYADTFHSQNTKVVVKEDGSADFETIMDFTSTKGTEYYIPISNLGKSQILNYRVSQILSGKEIPYEHEQDWDTNASIDEKQGKYGIIKTSSGYELCFGIGDYSRKTFVLRYTVSNFAKILNDSDMLFWKFVNNNLSAGPLSVKISISKENGDFNENNSKIWGFGSKGTVHFVDGKIEFNSSEKISSSNYVTILSKVDKGYFKDGEKISKDFSYYKDQAFKGSSYKKPNKKYYELYQSFMKFLPFIVFGILGIALKKSNKFKGGHQRGEFKGEYYRTVPEKEWWNMSLILESAKFDGYKAVIRAYFLKWIQDKLLIPITEEEGFIFKKDVVSLKINDKIDYDFVDSTEQTLFEMLQVAARDDMILQKNEFSKYLKKERNQRAFKNLINKLNSKSKTYLSDKGYLEKGNNGKITQKYNEEGKKFTENLIKYYNYLNDFTLLSERELTEIKVWKELLIYATLFDVAEKVESQLKKLSPEFIEQQDIDVYDLHRAMIYSQVFSSGFIDAYSRSVEQSSGGGGGFTSVGGGGGSFGGGSGGGSR
ncbi:MAG: DUF2207 domain-containing protein [Peptoniphilaceae bacterium]|uniref:DUF2207 family protein n=1 Tax=Parvimonas sp. TaxID=1944660 RepID=UPI002A751857|nr:DUF2207 domain-containing protein [Parvimonas sp.]MDD7764573.1 DUF2207 domain-containing protein [Peptoniphilaceae bacterium]MDY3050551.1 DUF2207 domain-containing protein [Parvimonas sp.]